MSEDSTAKGDQVSEDIQQQTSQETASDKPTPEGKTEAAAEQPTAQEEAKEEKPQLSDPEEPEDGAPISLVTGASGYVATHILKQLLEQGRVRVRGTVRNLSNEKKVKPLRDGARPKISAATD